MEKSSLSLKDTGRIYLDHNATTPPLVSVQENLAGWAHQWGNPSSIHWSGRGPKNILRESRAVFAELIKAHPLEIIFTSCGSESNNLAIKGFFEAHKNPERKEYITSMVEHPSVMKSFAALERRGAIVHYIGVSRAGAIDLEQYKKLLSARTALVSIMFANNETGTIFPIREMADAAHAVGALFHTDAVQTLGKVAVDVQAWGVDFASFAGHKVYALRGVGVLYVKKGQKLESLIHGGGQERGRRAGTENILAIASLGHVAGMLLKAQADTGGVKGSADSIHKMQNLRDQLEQKIKNKISSVVVTGVESPRLGNTSSLLIDGIDGESLLINLDIEGISVSTGAACSSGNPEPSPVLLAMGLSRSEAQRSLRISLGWSTTSQELDTVVEKLAAVVERLRAFRTELVQNKIGKGES